MSISEFKHLDLKLVNPSFESPLTDLIIELNYLRKKQLGGTTNPSIFFQLKDIFHFLESIGSARIEGNNTTIADFVEAKIEGIENSSENLLEIQNIDFAMSFIEENVKEYPINSTFVKEIHKLVVSNLGNEGDKTPGSYRKTNLKINKSEHLPPDWLQVENYMMELFEFINTEHNPKYDLMKTAIAHHRFVWIHPFGNGNGRTVRLLTYAMLIKNGFNVSKGRILNPTAIFCVDRNNYYNNLAYADSGTDDGLHKWIEYVLNGLKIEIEKIDKLSDYTYLKNQILIPAINYAQSRTFITPIEAKILKRVLDVLENESNAKAGDFKDILADKHPTAISREIKKLVDKKMLRTDKERGQKYIICFNNNYLLRGIIEMLKQKGFIAIQDN